MRRRLMLLFPYQYHAENEESGAHQKRSDVHFKRTNWAQRNSEIRSGYTKTPHIGIAGSAKHPPYWAIRYLSGVAEKCAHSGGSRQKNQACDRSSIEGQGLFD